MTGQPLIDAFIRKDAETASIPQTYRQPGAGTIDARLDRLLADPQHQCRLGLRQSFDRAQDQWLLERTGQGVDRRNRSLELLALQEKPLWRRGVVLHIISRVYRQLDGETYAAGAEPLPVAVLERTCVV